MHVYIYHEDTYANKLFIALQVCPYKERFVEYKYALLYK